MPATTGRDNGVAPQITADTGFGFPLHVASPAFGSAGRIVFLVTGHELKGAEGDEKTNEEFSKFLEV